MQRRACLTVQGAEAATFLQNLVTCDVEIGIGELTFGALLTPQGKVMFDFFVLREANGYLFDTLADARDELVRRLFFYKLRAAVLIEADDRVPLLTADGHADPRSASLPMRSYGSGEDDLQPFYDLARLNAGVPDAGSDFDYGDAFPHDVLMDRFERSGSGVAFRKGCYVGQEVVSRMQHRGTARRRPIVLDVPPTAAAGDEVLADGRAVGKLGTVVDGHALAIVRLDRVEAAEVVTVREQSASWKPSPLLQGGP